MLLRWCSCDCWRAGTCLESVIGSGSCHSETRAQLLVSDFDRGREQQIRVDLLPLPTPPAPSHRLLLPFNFALTTSLTSLPSSNLNFPHSLLQSSPLLSVFLLTQTTYSSIVAAPHPPRTSRSLHTLLSKRVVGRGKQSQPCPPPQAPCD